MTTTYGGATVALKLERLAAEGKIAREFIGILIGDDNDQDLYTHRFPITDSVGVATDAETEVDVFSDDLTPGSWTEYAEDGSDYVIIGATGKVTIQAAENAPGNEGERISISYYTSEEPAVGQNVSISHSQPLTEIYKLGSTDPQEIKEGNISIGGTIGVLYANRSLFGTILGVSDFYKKLSAYSFYLYPNKEVTGQPQIKLTGVKFSGATLGTEIGGPVAFDIEFKGLLIAVGSVPA